MLFQYLRDPSWQSQYHLAWYNIHNGQIEVTGYIQTSNGIKLEKKEIENKKNIEEIQERVLSLRNKGESYTKILKIIDEEYKESNITLYRIKKWLK